MKSVVVKSAPALAVLFVLVFGFVAFHVLIQNTEASGNDCAYLTAQCETEAANVISACHNPPINQERCDNANNDYAAVCSSAANACNS